MVTQGSNLFDSRSNCEPAQSAWESISGEPQLGPSVDAHLLRRVLKPGGAGRLGPSFFAAWPAAARGGGHVVRKALNDNPVAQIAVLGVLAVIVAFLLMTQGVHSGDSGSTATSATPGRACAGGHHRRHDLLEPCDRRRLLQAPAPPRWRRRPPGRRHGSAAPRLGEFVAGPGLPAPVVKAYADDKAVVLFVFRHRGIDDAAVQVQRRAASRPQRPRRVHHPRRQHRPLRADHRGRGREPRARR